MDMEFSGIVRTGEGFGRKLGFPTVNIDEGDYVAQSLDAAHGVYAGFVTILSTGEKYPAGIVIGPNTEYGYPKLEAHLIGYTGDLYGEAVTYSVGEFIRPFTQYETMEELTSAIANDIEHVTKLTGSISHP